MQSAIYCRDRDLKQARDLSGMKGKHIREKENGSLTRREHLQDDEKGQGNALVPAVACFRILRRLGQPTVRKGSSQSVSEVLGATGIKGSQAEEAEVGSVRGECFLSRSRLTLVAIVYSQFRSDPGPFSVKVSKCLQARSIVSCTASSASCNDPRRR